MANQRTSSEDRTGISSRTGTGAKTRPRRRRRVERRPAGLAKANKELLLEVLRRRQIEAQLRESEKRERTILDSIPDLAWLKDRRGRYLAVNEAWCRFFRVRAGEAVGKTSFDILPRDFPRKVSRDDRKVIRSGEPFFYEELIPSKSGQMIWRETVKTPLRNKQGVVVGTVGITHDITARKKAQEALEASELAARRLQEKLTTLHDVVLELSRARSFHELCRQAILLGLRRLGFDRLGLWFSRPGGEIVGSFGTDESGRLRDERGVRLRPLPKGEVSRMLAGQVRLAVMDEVPLMNHRNRAVGRGTNMVAALRDGENVIGYLGADNLIHRRPFGPADQQVLLLYASALGHLCSRLRAEESLRQSEEKYRQIFATETDALVLIDAQTRRYIDVNESACRLYGYAREEFLRLRQLGCSAESEASARSLVELDRKKGLFVPLRLHKKKDGTRFPVEISANTFVLRGRRMICAAIRDISDRRRTEEALRAARSKLDGAREEERRRLSRELHDSLAQTLVAMNIRLKTFAEQASASLSDSQITSLAELARQFQEVFKQVRQVSRTLYPPTLEPFGLCAALKQLGSDLQSDPVRIRVRCEPSLAEARFQLATEIELFRIAQEAASNALRHGRCGQVDLSLRRSKGFLRLTVADDGKGFDTKKNFRRGLGLISMRERAESIGGTLRITSRPGRTCVEVRAPAKKR